MNGVSVIICCYNSSLRLPTTLEYLAKQKIEDSIFCEVIVIDNLSTDNTRFVAYAEWEKHRNEKIELRVIDQPIQGQAFARDLGVQESKYDVLIFCDDDNRLDENYLFYSYSFLSSHKEAGAVGGHGMVTADVDIPEWFNQFREFYACSPQGIGIEDITNTRGYLYGAGLAVRKEAWKSVKSYDNYNILSGRSGSALTSGDDVELCIKLKILGWQLWYNSDLRFFHYMTKERLTLDYLYRITKGTSSSGIYLNLYKYFIEGKVVTRIVWLKDVVYKCTRCFQSAAKLLIDDNIQNRVNFYMHSSGIKSLAHQFFSYRTNYLKIKKNFEGITRIDV